MTGVLIMQEKYKNTEGRRPSDNRGRDGSDAATSQGRPRIASNNRSYKETRKDPPLETSKGNMALLIP